jgi:hypothetical protein
VCIIVCALNVTLFFKVWGMCDNVKRLTEHFCEVDEFSAMKPSLLDFTSGKEARNALVADLRAIAKKAQGLTTEDYERIYGSNPDTEIAELIAEYKKVYKNLGESFPGDLAKVKSIEDLWDMFD